ncbi:MAG: YbaK/EbsC family protein [Sedimentisphaerales bacterium]|nr:YbaK/EbsC family protein [Sedimentisphaerales bacterium]
MRVTKFLDQAGVKYDVREHTPVFTSQGLAQREHERGKYVAKPVIVRADNRYVMCVLPAPQKVDLSKLKEHLGADVVELANEDQIAKLFPDCELGAEPPFGNLYDLATFMDKTLEQDDHIMVQAGTHAKAIRMSMADYQRLVRPKVLELAL